MRACSLECTGDRMAIRDDRSSFVQFWARSSAEKVWPQDPPFASSFRNVDFGFRGDTGLIHGEPSINAHLLRVVDCSCGVPESLLCRRYYFLWIPGFLPRFRGVPGIHARASHAGVLPRISFGGPAVWLAGGSSDRPDRRAMGHSIGSRPRRYFSCAHGVHDQALALRTILHHGSSRLRARGTCRQSSPRRSLVPSSARPGDGLRVSRVRARRSRFAVAGSFFDEKLRLAAYPGDRGLADTGRVAPGGDRDHAFHSCRNGASAGWGGKQWPARRKEQRHACARERSRGCGSHGEFLAYPGGIHAGDGRHRYGTSTFHPLPQRSGLLGSHRLSIPYSSACFKPRRPRSSGFPADRFRKKNTMALFYALLSASVLLLGMAHQSVVVWTFALIFGFSMGADYMLIPLVTAECFGTASLGKLLALIIMGYSLGQWGAPWMAGRIFDARHSYDLAWKLMAIAGVIGAAAIYVVSARSRGKQS